MFLLSTSCLYLFSCSLGSSVAQSLCVLCVPDLFPIALVFVFLHRYWATCLKVCLVLILAVLSKRLQARFIYYNLLTVKAPCYVVKL